jgi:hypothetical protein
MNAMRLVLMALIASVAAIPARAQDAPADAERPPGALERAGITGSLRAGYWSSTRNLDGEANLGAGMMWIKATRPISNRASFLVEGWTGLRTPFDDGDATGELREAFVDLRFGRLDLRVGRQIIAWGRADGVNPTDNLTGEDFTLLTPDEDDRRLGGTAVRASYYVGGVSISGLWLPEFRGHRFPLPPPPPGVAFVHDRPDWPGDQWAVRVEQTGRAVDWSVSYFSGRDPSPDLQPQAGVVRLAHHRVRIAGADLAANAGRFGLRAEAAYVDTADTSGHDPFTKNPFFFLVAGADRTFREHLNLNVQYLHRVVFDYRRPEGELAALQAVVNGETERVQHGASFRVAYKWFHDTLEAECAAAGYFDPRGVTLRPKVAYSLSDRWKAIVGAELFRGQASSLFGLLRQNSTAFVELRRSF